MSFDIFKFDNKIARRIEALKYETPTPIQAEAIPSVLKGKDVMGLAQTGTGKTAAYVLPLLQRLLRGKKGTLRVLILAPTRELAEQIHGVIKDFSERTGLISLPVYGGVGDGPQVRAIKKGVDILVACPGRLLDLLGQGIINFEPLEALVLDEADQMLDMGFFRDIRKIRQYIPSKPQTLLFSATMPPDIKRLSKELLHHPELIEVDHEMPLDTIAHIVYPVAHYLKTPLLFAILEQSTPYAVLLFTRTKYRARSLAQKLKKRGFSATALQGDMSQNRRKAAMEGFKSGEFQVLVATDIAARGIDISHISHVINYDMPDTLEAYTHRIGRTGRAERNGEAFSLVTKEDKNMIGNLEYNMGQRFISRTIEGFDYNAPDPSTKKRIPPKPGRKNSPFRKPSDDKKTFRRTGANAKRTKNNKPRPQGSVRHSRGD